ncbi:hypothetical protein, partial [Mesorhizobium sp. A623]
MTEKNPDIERHFERRMKAAKIGLHLPSEEELLRGMAFFDDELRSDIREYASRLTRRMKNRGREELAPLINCLDLRPVFPPAYWRIRRLICGVMRPAF